ncbi:unnamed protein product [Closterium sp. NIES-53]
MVCTRVLQQQGQPQHSWQWGPEGPRSTGRSGGLASSGHDVGPCGYRILTGPGFGTTCWSLDHSASRCYRRLDDLHCVRFGPHTIPPHWPSHNRQRTAAPAESHLPGQGPFPAARVETCVSSLGACVVSSPGASERLCVGVETTTSLAPAFVAGSGATSQTAQLSFTLESGASSYFFRDCTDVTPLRTPVTIALADPSVGPVVAHSTTTLPCPVAPSGFLTGYYTPSFSRSLVGVSHLLDLGVVTTFPLDEPVASCTVGATRAPLATFHREPGSGLYSLHTRSHHTGSGQVRAGHPSFPCLSRMARYRLVPGLPESLAPLPRSPAPPCTPCVEGRQRAAPHSSSFPPTTAPFQTLHLDVWGPSPVLGPRQERYFLIVVDNYSRYTTGFPLRRKADVPTILEPWLLAWGGAQGLCGLRLHSDRGGDFSSTHLQTANKLSPLTRACVVLGFPLDTSGWEFYDPVTYQFFTSQVVTFDEFVCYYRSRPHRGTDVFSPPLFLTLEPPPVAPVAPPPLRPAPLGVLHVTPQSSPPQRPVPVVSGGAGGAVAEGEGNGAAGAGGVGSGGAGVVGVEVTLVEDTAASNRRPRPASPPGFPSVPQFRPRSSLRPVAAEPGGVPAGGTKGPRAVGGGGARSGGAGVGGTGTVAPTPRTVRFLTRDQRLLRLEREERERGGATAAAGESRGGVMAAAAGAVAAAAGESRGGVMSAAVGVVVVAAGEIRGGVMATPGEGRAGVPPTAAGTFAAAAGESRGGVTSAAAGAVAVSVLSHQKPEEAERQRLRLRDLLDPALARLVRGPLPSPHVPPVLSLSLSLWTRRSPLSLAVSPEPRRSGYRADGPFHLVLRSRARPPPILPQPPKSSLAVLHDPLSDYLRASRPIVSRVLSALVTHSTAPLPSVSALVTIVAGFASSHRLDYAAHLVSGPARSPSFGGALVFALEVLEDMQFELGFLAATVPHLCAKLLALEGDPNALDIPIPRNHAEAVLGPWASYWIAVEEAEMASYRSTSTYVDAVPPPGTNVVSGRWLYKVKRPPGSPLVFKARYVTRGFSQREGVDFFQTFAPTPKMTTLWVLLRIAAQRDYELQSLHFSTAFLQGSLHEQIWLRRPPSFIGSFPPGTQWQLHGPVYGLRQAPHERHDTLCSTLAALDFFPSSADPSLFVRRGSTPFFVLVYVDDLAFATLDRRALASVKEELQRRHTCTDLGELQHYIGLQIVM